jgi:hypothetical protein
MLQHLACCSISLFVSIITWISGQPATRSGPWMAAEELRHMVLDNLDFCGKCVESNSPLIYTGLHRLAYFAPQPQQLKCIFFHLMKFRISLNETREMSLDFPQKTRLLEFPQLTSGNPRAA